MNGQSNVVLGWLLPKPPVLKVANLFFADKLCDIINLSFITGIFPDLCKLAKARTTKLHGRRTRKYGKIMWRPVLKMTVTF